MNLGQAVILAIVEGVTEFLPISSTAHLMLVSGWIGLTQNEFVKSFEIIIQLAAIAAVVVIYAGRVWKDKKLWAKLAVGFVPTGILGLVFYKIVKTYLLGNATLAMVMLVVGGLIMLWWEKKGPVGKKEIEDLSFKQAIGVGISQSLAMIPGVSRSAATVYAGMGLGLSRKAAVELSFWLAVPTMAAATGLDMVKNSWSFSGQEWTALVVAFGVTFVTAWLSVKWLLKNLQSNSWKGLAIYRIVVALAWLATYRIT